jgi:hypothetical protein
MNFLAGSLLLYLPSEAAAFGCLAALLRDQGLAGLYLPTMPLLQVRLTARQAHSCPLG